jgi:hypothetical protein
MWCVSGTGWDVVAGAARHRYHIKYAESRNGSIAYDDLCGLPAPPPRTFRDEVAWVYFA